MPTPGQITNDFSGLDVNKQVLVLQLGFFFAVCVELLVYQKNSEELDYYWRSFQSIAGTPEIYKYDSDQGQPCFSLHMTDLLRQFAVPSWSREWLHNCAGAKAEEPPWLSDYVCRIRDLERWSIQHFIEAYWAQEQSGSAVHWHGFRNYNMGPRFAHLRWWETTGYVRPVVLIWNAISRSLTTPWLQLAFSAPAGHGDDEWQPVIEGTGR
jgi:hypothetical protein